MLKVTKAQVRASLPQEAIAQRSQRHVHLSRQRQLELVERFRAGALQRELAEAYGIHRTTVAAIVERHRLPRQST
jgi:hypothetical protein